MTNTGRESSYYLVYVLHWRKTMTAGYQECVLITAKILGPVVKQYLILIKIPKIHYKKIMILSLQCFSNNLKQN